MKLVVITGGVSDPSSTGMLADRVSRSVRTQANARNVEVAVQSIELRTVANEIATGLVSQLHGTGLAGATTALRTADAIVAATPVYKAGISGLFKSFVDLLDDDLMIAKPVLLAATAGTARHALVVDEAMRSLFTYMRALPVPTGVFAAPQDWASVELGARIDRAAGELLTFAESGIEDQIRGTSWGRYQHELGSNGGQELGIDLDSTLMHLATGGSAV